MRALINRFLDRLLAPSIAPSIKQWRRARADMRDLKWRSWEKRWARAG